MNESMNKSPTGLDVRFKSDNLMMGYFSEHFAIDSTYLSKYHYTVEGWQKYLNTKRQFIQKNFLEQRENFQHYSALSVLTSQNNVRYNANLSLTTVLLGF